MASIADLLGVQWDQPSGNAGGYALGHHAAKQATEKGFDHSAVLRAAEDPHHTYDNGRYAGQKRHIRGDIVAVVDPAAKRVVTVYQNVKETALRADQTDADAQAYGRRLNAKPRPPRPR